MKYTILLLICFIANNISSNNSEERLYKVNNKQIANIPFNRPEERIYRANNEQFINILLKDYTNPIGLINTSVNWDFEIKNNKGKFEKFVTPESGLRAGMKNLYNAIKLKKIKNNYELIKRHNDEKKYINNFFKISKLSKSTLINNDNDFVILIKTIVFLETSITLKEDGIIKIKDDNFFKFKNK